MVTQAKAIRQQKLKCLSVFDHFVGLLLKGLRFHKTFHLLKKKGFIKTFDVLFFFETPVLRCALLAYYRLLIVCKF